MPSKPLLLREIGEAVAREEPDRRGELRQILRCEDHRKRPKAGSMPVGGGPSVDG